MENIHKKLAYALWTVSGISALLSVISYVTFENYLGLIGVVIALVFQVLLGYTILRDKNDTFTMISVILIAVFTFNLGGLVAIIIRLVLRKKDTDKVRGMWFVPAIVSAVLALINLFFLFSVLNLVSLLLNVAYYLIFGYWFIKYLRVR